MIHYCFSKFILFFFSLTLFHLLFFICIVCLLLTLVYHAVQCHRFVRHQCTCSVRVLEDVLDCVWSASVSSMQLAGSAPSVFAPLCRGERFSASWNFLKTRNSIPQCNRITGYDKYLCCLCHATLTVKESGACNNELTGSRWRSLWLNCTFFPECISMCQSESFYGRMQMMRAFKEIHAALDWY